MVEECRRRGDTNLSTLSPEITVSMLAITDPISENFQLSLLRSRRRRLRYHQGRGLGLSTLSPEITVGREGRVLGR